MSYAALPQRLNLAIGRRCEVACSGCYTYFGRDEPSLVRLLPTVAKFVRLGVDKVTLSGGDPLTIEGIVDFLGDLKAAGVRSIKFDTVGVGLATATTSSRIDLRGLAAVADYIGIPVDGWSNESVLEFRRGRRQLFTETMGLLGAFSALGGRPNVVVHTVAHARNLDYLERIYSVLAVHSCVRQWSIFQYMPTDQAGRGANRYYAVSDEKFEQCCERLLGALPLARSSESNFQIELLSNRSRLGQYLLINSDGDAWLPDADGRTLMLGSVFGQEEQILDSWRRMVNALLRRTDSLETPSELLHLARM
jgi:MoaA/NifB/PqqE/SkfB family radical SAM enzyme